jgi:hypothetical protein
MLQIVEKQVINKVNRIQELKEIEYVKGEMYSIFSILILSEKQFNRNLEIKEFLGKFNISFKDYVYVSRTSVLARVLREIEKSDEERVRSIGLILFNELNSENVNVKNNYKKAKRNDDYLLGILDRYTRNDKK